MNRNGVVLIAVLWICTLVMWFTLQIGTETRLLGEEQVQLFRRTQALHLAIGGCYEALARMGQPPSTGLDREAEMSWQPDGTFHLLRYETGEILVSIQSESQKININETNPEQMKLVLLRAGIPENSVEELADVIGDFIDPDDIPRLHGAEKEAYQRLGLPYGPFNGPLLSIDQLLIVPGITPAAFYGFLRTDGEFGDEETTIASSLPSKDSLFEMLSVYGTSTTLPGTELLQEIGNKVITWEEEGIYRIYSIGRTFTGSAPVTVCLIVQYRAGGYDVLYRKIM